MIVFFMPDLRAGGAERVMLTLLGELSKTEPDIYVLLLGKREGPLLDLLPEGIDVFELGVSSGSKMVLPFIKFCYEQKPKVVFATLGASLTTALAKLFISSSITLVNRLGNTIGAEKALYSNPIKRYMYIFANKIIAKKSDKLIFQCHYMKADFIKETNCKLKDSHVIYNPADIDRIERLSQEESKLGDFDFVAVGRLNTQKDYFTLLRASKLLKDKQIKFTLAILGEGNLREALEQSICELNVEDCVFLLGHQSNPYPLMKSTKFLVSSSLYEGFSNVIVESLCLGTPILASDCPGGNSETIDELNGRLFPVQNQEKLAQLMFDSLIECFAFDKDNIMKKAQGKYELSSIAKRYKKIIIE